MPQLGLRFWLIVAALAGAGVGLGFAGSLGDLMRLRKSDAELLGMSTTARKPVAPVPPEAIKLPVAYAPELTFNFGRMERETKQSHTFVIENRGEAPLELKQGETTCKCTLSGLDRNLLEPGQTASVSLEWTATSDSNNFRQRAAILTNDPKQETLQFLIEGQIFDVVRLDPNPLVINQSTNETREYRVEFLSELYDDLKITGQELADTALAPYLALSWEPLTDEQRRRAQFFMPELKAAQNLVVAVKPGLRPGPLQQTITVHTGLAERPKIEVTVAGTISGNVSIAGARGWSSASSTLNLGTVNRAQGAERMLKVLLHGPQREKIEVRVAKVTPEFVQVTLGEGSPLGERARQIPLTVHVPPGSPEVTHLSPVLGGLGEVVLETSDPDQPQVTFKLAFAIEG